ncbi:MAG: tyrosine-type recombinase/integrase [Acidobacteriaceae bacterium]
MEPLAVNLTFTEAFGQWIGRLLIDPDEAEGGARDISSRTEQDLRQYASAAGKFLGRLRLEEIHLGHLREYQRARAMCDQGAAAWAQPAGANLIRKELQTVIRVLDAAGLWDDKINRRLRRVRATESDVPRAMTPAQQKRFLDVANSREDWKVVYWYSQVSLKTTAATNEMRSLRLDGVETGQGSFIQVRTKGAKNKFRVRTIPVKGREAREALQRLVDRAKSLGAKEPAHHLFPLHRGADHYDPRRPMTRWGLRKRFEEVRDAAELPGLRIYDLRHAALTRMAEKGAPIHVMMAFAGHMTMRMQRHYIAISMAAKEEWAEEIWGDGGGGALPPKKGPQSVPPSHESGKSTAQKLFG